MKAINAEDLGEILYKFGEVLTQEEIFKIIPLAIKYFGEEHTADGDCEEYNKNWQKLNLIDKFYISDDGEHLLVECQDELLTLSEPTFTKAKGSDGCYLDMSAYQSVEEMLASGDNF